MQRKISVDEREKTEERKTNVLILRTIIIIFQILLMDSTELYDDVMKWKIFLVNGLF